MEEKICNCCGQSKPVSKFRQCCDAYTGQKRWRRNTCNRCEYLARLHKRLRQFTPANA
jgi:hypothetical protein